VGLVRRLSREDNVSFHLTVQRRIGGEVIRADRVLWKRVISMFDLCES
jgi:hypothetical protein